MRASATVEKQYKTAMGKAGERRARIAYICKYSTIEEQGSSRTYIYIYIHVYYRCIDAQNRIENSLWTR